jgi:hypothetical protein
MLHSSMSRKGLWGKYGKNEARFAVLLNAVVKMYINSKTRYIHDNHRAASQAWSYIWSWNNLRYICAAILFRVCLCIDATFHYFLHLEDPVKRYSLDPVECNPHPHITFLDRFNIVLYYIRLYYIIFTTAFKSLKFLLCFFILQFLLLDYILIIFIGGQSIALFFIQPPSQVQSFSSELCLDIFSKSVILLQNDIKFQIHTEYQIKLY